MNRPERAGSIEAKIVEPEEIKEMSIRLERLHDLIMLSERVFITSHKTATRILGPDAESGQSGESARNNLEREPGCVIEHMDCLMDAIERNLRAALHHSFRLDRL